MGDLGCQFGNFIFLGGKKLESILESMLDLYKHAGVCFSGDIHPCLKAGQGQLVARLASCQFESLTKYPVPLLHHWFFYEMEEPRTKFCKLFGPILPCMVEFLPKC